MLNRIESIYVGVGLALRVFLFFQTKIRNYFEDSGEFVTPLNSWKRVIEGIYLRKLNLSPFVGSIVHEVCKMNTNKQRRYSVIF
jgi:phosphatidylinositol glycan class U